MDVLVPLVSIVVVTGLLTFWVWMFWDMTKNEDLAPNAKNTWTLLFVFASIFAAIYYYANVYRNRI